ncbi:MAG TPA: hypothetical protein PLT68_00905 [Actinomycetota bacterium]|nr:hypothetical protein [Actinomycetota bacterium]
MRTLGALAAALVWTACWLILPASWWFNTRILDEDAFTGTMRQALLNDGVQQQITARATSQVIDQTRRFLHTTLPAVSVGTDALLVQAEPVVTGLVGEAVASKPGEQAMLATSRQAHAFFLAWLDQDSLGQPGLRTDLGEGTARFDLDELLTGQHISIGPLQVPLDVLDLPGLDVPVPMPPDWMRIPLTVLRWAWIPALTGIALSTAALLALGPRRLRGLAIASGSTAVLCAGSVVFAQNFPALSGSGSSDAGITIGVLTPLVQPLLTAYAWLTAAMAMVAVLAWLGDRHRLVGNRPPA